MTRTGRLVMAAALLWIGFGVGGRAEADISLSTPAGLSAGESFRFVFVTDGLTTALSTDIADYNSFVNTQAGGATYNGSVVSWVAIGSTPFVNAIDNVGQTMTPVYLASGQLVTTNTTSTGLWSGTLLNPIDQDLTGTQIGFPTIFIWTGTNSEGLGEPERQLGIFPGVEVGIPSLTTSAWVAGDSIEADSGNSAFYGISQVLVVPGVAAVPEPSTLLIAGAGIIAGVAFGWSRSRRDQRRQRPLG